MKVSIIIPYFKRKALFLNQIRSILASDYPCELYEVIVVEDGSSDFNQADLAQMSANFRYFNSNKKAADPGRTPPRNIGIQHATGDLIIFLDCDQILAEDFITNHVAFHLAHPYPVLQLGTRKNLLRDTDLADLLNQPYEADVRSLIFTDYQSDGTDLLGVWALCWSHNISIRKLCIDQHGGFDDGFVNWGLEDVEFGLRMHRAGVNLRHNPKIEVFHQYHPPAYGARIYNGWLKNYQYLLNKYQGDFDVAAMRLVADIIDPSYTIQVDRNRINEASALHYKRFETTIRCFRGLITSADVEVFPTESFLRCKHGVPA